MKDRKVEMMHNNINNNYANENLIFEKNNIPNSYFPGDLFSVENKISNPKDKKVQIKYNNENNYDDKENIYEKFDKVSKVLNIDEIEKININLRGINNNINSKLK